MNATVYRFIFNTYGRKARYWIGLVGEIIRNLMLRVWVVIIMAQTATNLASRHISAAKHDALSFLLVYIIGTIVGAAAELVAITAENEQYVDLGIVFTKKLTGKDMSFYRDNQSGYLVSLFRMHLDGALNLTRFIRTDLIRTVISMIMPAFVLGFLNWKLGCIAALVVLIQAVYIVWSSARANAWREKSHEIYRKLTAEVADAITNITAYRSSGVESAVLRQVKQLANQEAETFLGRHKLNVALDLPRDFITASGITAALYIILSTSSNKPASVGLTVLVLTYMFQIVRTVGDLPKLMTQHDDMITKIYPTLTYLSDSFETVKDHHDPMKLRITHGAINIQHVNLSYMSSDNRNVPIFQDLNIEIAGGEQVGIVGLSGAGKSTLASLVMRFDDVTAGTISIDGIDIRDVRQSALHRAIAYVPQEPLLFHKTIKENIAYFNAKASEASIVRAAKAAYAHDFINSLPNGYDSLVGERGIKLSGGQKQRIVIARAILKNAPIMIFDEATSALDSESEKIIQQALPAILGKRTAIIIAHRLSTIANLDRILVMDHGRIIESGTHLELLELDGRYASLWHKQSLQSRKQPAPVIRLKTRTY